jgi:hypothetical protein
MLWAAFNERREVHCTEARTREEAEFFSRHGVGPGEEVCLLWTPRRFRRGLVDWKLSHPRLVVMVCHQGAFEDLTDAWKCADMHTILGMTPYRPFVSWTPNGIDW